MPLPPRLFSAAFHEQRLGLVLTLIVGAMVYLGTLALGAQGFLGSSLFSWGEDVQSSLTIEVPFPAEMAAEAHQHKIGLVADAVRAVPYVKDAVVVARADTVKLLKPWVDDPLLISALPLPGLVDVTFTKGATIDDAALQALVRKIAPEARLDRHADWLHRLADLMRFATFLSGGLVLLIGSTLIVAIALVCKVAFATQHGTVDLLHVMGATNNDIAAQFRSKIAQIAWPPALIAYLLGLLSLIALGWLLAAFFDLSTLMGDGFYWRALGAAIGVGIVPLVGVIASVLTAHLSVLRLLKRRAR